MKQVTISLEAFNAMKEALAATFEQRPGSLQLVSKAVRLMPVEQPVVKGKKIMMMEIDSDIMYQSADGYVLSRESFQQPEGCPFPSMRWVLRDPSGAFLDRDQYRYDLAERQNLLLS